MDDCFYKFDLDDFMNLMKLPNGTPLVPFDMIDYLMRYGFFTAPASTKYHGAYKGGLYHHSLTVTKFLLRLTEDNKLIWRNERSPYIVGMFHDLCKIDQYRVKYFDGMILDEAKQSVYRGKTQWEHNPDTLLKGHGEKSVMLLSQFYALTEEEICCIRYHMGAFTPKEEWNDYTGAIHAYPNVLWTHQADMLASHVAGV